jgi:cytochrome P450
MTNANVTAPQLPWDAEDPYPFYDARRREGEVMWDDTAQAWLVLGYQPARDVLTGAGWTSDPRANQAAGDLAKALDSPIIDASMLFTDGHTHDRLRNAVRDVFTRSFINQLTEGVEAICAGTVGALATDETFDAMSEIALPLPVAIIGAWLGLDSDQCAALREHSPAIIRLLGGFTDDDELQDGLSASAALIADFLPAAADRRTHPRDDLLSLIAADPALALDEVVVTAILIAVAGHETTANLLGANLIRLLTPLADGSRLADHVDPDDPAVITELLRLDSPVQAVARTATGHQTLGGIEIGCGDAVLVSVAAANRDPAVYDRPTDFNPGRPGPGPITFGHGAHYCLGAALARLETTTALRHILSRRPVLTGPSAWRNTPAIRGPLTIPTRFTT